jgi:hypothetical protein
MDSNEKNGLLQNGAASVTQEATSTENGEYLSFEDVQKEEAEAEEPEPARKRKSKRLIGVILVILVLAAAGATVSLVSNDQMKIRIPVREPVRKSEPTTARSNNDGSMTAEAIRDIRNEIRTPTPAPSGSPVSPTGVKGATVTSTTPITIPMDGVAATRPSATETATGQSDASSGATAPIRRVERNPERSIRCAPTPVPVPVHQSIAERSPISPHRTP